MAGMLVPIGFCVLFVLMVCLLGTAIYAKFELNRFTPMYTDLVYKPTNREIRNIDLSPIKVEYETYITMWNPNPYEIFVTPTGPGDVWLNDLDVTIATVESIDVMIPPSPDRNTYKSAIIPLKFSTTEKFAEQVNKDTLLAIAKGQDVVMTLYFTKKLLVFIEPQVFQHRPASLELTSEYICGMRLKLSSRRTTDVICADSLPELKESLPDFQKRRRRLQPLNHSQGEHRLGERRLYTYTDSNEPPPVDGRNPKVDRAKLDAAQQDIEHVLGTIFTVGLAGSITIAAILAAWFVYLGHLRKDWEGEVGKRGYE